MVADAALGRAARDVVRDAVALEGLDRAVVHRHRDRDDDRLLALLQDVHQALVDLEDVGHAAQLLAGDLERVLAKVGLGRFDGGHGTAERLSIGPYLMRNAIVRIVGGALLVGERDQPHGVAAGVERVAAGAASGEADRDAAGEQVAQAREQAEPLAGRARARRRACATGWTSAPTALGTTSPACSESTAGVVSEGLNALDERATAEIRSCRCGPNVIAHGIFSGPAPRATQQHRALGRAAVGRRAVQPRAQRAPARCRPASAAPSGASGSSSRPPLPVLRTRTSRAPGRDVADDELLRRVPAVALARGRTRA